MSLRSWFRSSAAPSSKSSSRSTTPAPNGEPSRSAEERKAHDMNDALRSMALIMNDDPEGAEALLRERGDASSFHQLGLGVSIFIRSILGFEKEVMTEASMRLIECESTSWADKVKTEKKGAMAGQLYPAGSEFALVYAGALLMNAIVGVLHESLTDAIKGFYKLRKAYAIMDSLATTEEALVREHGSKAKPTGLASAPPAGDVDEADSAEIKAPDPKPASRLGGEEDADLEFVDASEALSEAPTPAGYGGHMGKMLGGSPASGAATPALEKRLAELQLSSSTPSSGARTPPEPLGAGPPAEAGIFTNPVDIFCHSANNMFYGILLLILSMVPPAFSRLLYVIGFKGDRARGVSSLWKSTSYHNVMGAVAAMVLLGYYHGVMAFTEILPTERDIEELADEDEIVGYPRERCAKLLGTMRERYPDSGFWKLEEARVLANERRLSEATDMLASNSESKMRQVAALNAFELALYAMFSLDWPRMHAAFLRMIELNDWSHTIYYFIAGCAELEMYRDAVHALAKLDADAAAPERTELETKVRRHKKGAEELLRKAPTVAGRKRFMARQLPFEVFTTRKLAKWEARAAALGVDLADAIGASPAAEMIYLWNGGKRMPPDVVEAALLVLAWDRCTAPADKLSKIKEEVDEMGIQGLGTAAFLRQVGRNEEARKILQGLTTLDRALFKISNREDYVLPMVSYELGVLAWTECCEPGHWPSGADEVDEHRKTKADECLSLLETVAAWETYVLDARFGVRVQTGLDSVRWLKTNKGWP
ncbi:hypothetical protein RB601_001296 [Gaeumannomyces tritici]